MKRQPVKSMAAKQTTPVDGEAKEMLDILEAKNRFISYTFGMGWRMAVAVIIPIFVGVKLDAKYHTDPSWTLVAFFVAVAGAVAVVRSTLREIKESQAEADKESKQSNA